MVWRRHELVCGFFRSLVFDVVSGGWCFDSHKVIHVVCIEWKEKPKTKKSNNVKGERKEVREKRKRNGETEKK